jgi:hypothetical protein
MLLCRAGRLLFTKPRVRCLTDYVQLASHFGVPLEKRGAFVMDVMAKDLDLMKKDLELVTVQKDLELERFRFEVEMKKMKASEAITTIRPLLVGGAFNACRQLANFITNNGVLSKGASEDILRLENEPHLQTAVDIELRDCFNELSESGRIVHLLPLSLRVAFALLVLELQRRSAVK